MQKIKDENYYQISGWMLNKLGLKGTELNIFAIIYGFTQDETTEFKGSLNYMCEFTGVSKPSVIKAINSLISKELVIKTEYVINNVKQNGYKANMGVVKNFNWGSKETLLGGSKETLPNNKGYKEIIDIYHQLCPSFPKCKTLSDKRKKQIKARLDTYSIEQIKEVFTNAENSDFLKGKVNGFKADFDWLMNDNNFAKTLEGKYNHTLTSPKSINNQQTKYNVTKSGTIDLSPKFIN